MPTTPLDFSAKALTDTNEGIILTAVQTRIVALALTQINAANIVIRKLPWDSGLTPPYIIISPFPEATPWQGATNELDRVTFAVLVSIVLADKRDVTTHGVGLQLWWRERIRRKFQNHSQATWALNASLMTGCFFEQSYVESGDKFIEAAKRAMYDAQYYVLRVRIKEPRE